MSEETTVRIAELVVVAVIAVTAAVCGRPARVSVDDGCIGIAVGGMSHDDTTGVLPASL